MGVIFNFNWGYLATPGNTNTNTVGWLADKAATGSPYQRMSAMLAQLRAVPFAAVLLPPSTKGAAGPFSGGYDLRDPYDVGSKDQCGEVATAFGTAEQLRQLVAIAHRYEMGVYIDLVLHQYDGGTAEGVYTSPGSGAPGRWPKHTTCFNSEDVPGGVPGDSVPNEAGNFGFGQRPSYQNATPPGYMWQGAIANAQWLVKTLGTDGMRIDDAKGTNADIVYDLTTAPGLTDQEVFWEYYDGNLQAIAAYAASQKWRGAALDFTTKFNLGNIANNNSRVWMGQLANIGWCIVDAANCITWAESKDTDTSPGEQTIWNKIFVYAVLMTFPGYPMVYARDYLTGPQCYGLGAEIDNLVWIHEKLAQGEFVVRLDTDFQVFAHERLGFGDAPGCTCFFNNDQYSAHTVTIHTKWGPDFRLHNYAFCGSVDDVWTDENGLLTVSVQANDNGENFLIYGPPGLSGGFDTTPQETNQTFFGASDLDIGPIVTGTLQVGRIWCAAGTWLSSTLTIDDASWGNSADLAVHITDDEGFLVMMPYDDQGDATQGHTTKAKLSGWHSISIVAVGMPEGGTPFSLRATYTGAPYEAAT